MAGITGLGTTFNEPNYHGELFAITPIETPLLSMAGGLGGGAQATSTEFEWQTYDLRSPSIRPRIEGANAPTAEERVRANVKNVVQIFHETVSTSYTKQGAFNQFSTTQAAPFWTYDGLNEPGNPVINEHTWQITQALTQIARDVNFSFWHGQKNVPTDTSTARQMAGLLQVITTNRTVLTVAGEVTAATATNVVTATAHGLANGDQVSFTNVDVATNIRVDQTYFVINQAANTFQVALTAGGAAITLGTAAPKYVRASGTGSVPVTVDLVNTLVQNIFDQGGMAKGGVRTLFVPSIQKVRLTKAYATAYGSNVNGAITQNTGHTVGGVAVDTIITDLGMLNLVVERALPKDCIVAVSMEQVDPVFLSIPNRGVLFEEQLAKVGSADNTQIYGEIGLKYGLERAHGVLRGLAVA